MYEEGEDKPRLERVDMEAYKVCKMRGHEAERVMIMRTGEWHLCRWCKVSYRNVHIWYLEEEGEGFEQDERG